MKHLPLFFCFALFFSSCSEKNLLHDDHASLIETRSISDAQFEAIENISIYFLETDTLIVDSMFNALDTAIANHDYTTIMDIFETFGYDSTTSAQLALLDSTDFGTVWTDSSVVLNQDFEDDYTDYIIQGKSILYTYDSLNDIIEPRGIYTYFFGNKPCALSSVLVMTAENAASGILGGAGIAAGAAAAIIPGGQGLALFSYAGAATSLFNIYENISHFVSNCV